MLARERVDFNSGSSHTRYWRRATNGDSTGTACDTNSCSGCSGYSDSGGIEDEGGGSGTVKDRGNVYSFSFSVSVSVSGSGSVSVWISFFVSVSGSSSFVGRVGESFKSVGIEERKGVGVIEG
jgi:hypothetical protein